MAKEKRHAEKYKNKEQEKKKWKDTDDWETIESNRSTPILLT